jgi:hypothetical protein
MDFLNIAAAPLVVPDGIARDDWEAMTQAERDLWLEAHWVSPEVAADENPPYEQTEDELSHVEPEQPICGHTDAEGCTGHGDF